MVKKDDSGSGLRAGFVRGDGMARPQKKTNPPEKEAEKIKNEAAAADKKQEPVPEPVDKKPEAENGPTITMQGVSGKKITGVVKVVKVQRPDKASTDRVQADEQTADANSSLASKDGTKTAVEKPAAASPAAPPPSVSLPHMKKPAKKTKSAQAKDEDKPKAAKAAVASDAAATVKEDKTEEKPAVTKDKPNISAEKKAEAKTQADDVNAQKTSAKTSQADLDAAPVTESKEKTTVAADEKSAEQSAEKKPAASVKPAPRPQGRRKINPNERAPGQGGDFTKRAPQGPQSGRQIRKEDYAPGQGGSYTSDALGRGQYRPSAGARPSMPGARPGASGGRPPQQGDRPAPQGGRGPRPGPSRGRPAGANVSDDLTEKLPEAPKANFAARDAFEKENKRDSKRDLRKDSSAKIEPVARDKHKTLKKQAQVLSGKGVNDVLSDDTLLDPFEKQPGRSGRGRGRRRNQRNQRNQQPRSSTPMVKAVLTHVKLPESLTVKEFSEAIKKTSAEVIKKLIALGIMATVNQEIDFDTATLIAAEFNITTEKLVEVTEEDILFDDSEDSDEDMQERPPVVVVMGHVDHGKTSILDRIREAAVVDGEAGGITQHIGAYMVTANDRPITFLDTPGHEAFTTMRARGAQVTDIAILVVAADDGVMPQTIEAINHAKAANTQIIVAINKIDKPDINIERVKQELSQHELIPEEWGGSTIMVPVSAMTGEGMDELLEMVLLTADILELKSNPDKQAKGTVIEAQLDKNRGPVATVLVQRGTLRTGDSLVTGSIIGHVRAMTDDHGKPLKEAGPSVPVEILGLPEVPEAGELFYAVTDDRTARALADKRRTAQREQQLRSSSRMNLESLFAQMSSGEVQDLNIIVKADVQGSVEAVRQALEKLTTEEIKVNVIHGAVGAVTESDVRLAEVSNAIIIGFNVRPAANASEMAKELSVDVRLYRVIYNAIEDIESAMKGMLAPEFKEVILGHAQVRQVFKVSGVGSIGGCYVTDGKITRASEVRLVRDGIVIHEGKLSSLKRFKDDAREVATGYECGISLERFNDIKENDVIEAYEMQEIERS